VSAPGLTGRLERLAEKAQAATPGPWTANREGVWMRGENAGLREGLFYPVQGVASNRAFIAAADPSVVAALVEVALLADDGHDADVHEPHPPEDGFLPNCELCAALARLADRLSTEGTK
jgi:hypothetical protein